MIRIENLLLNTLNNICKPFLLFNLPVTVLIVIIFQPTQGKKTLLFLCEIYIVNKIYLEILEGTHSNDTLTERVKERRIPNTRASKNQFSENLEGLSFTK